MKKAFKYQTYWLKVFGFVPVMLLAYLFRLLIINNLNLPNGIIHIVDFILTFLFIYIYCSITEKYDLYTREGRYWIDGKTLNVYIDGELNRIMLDNIEEVIMKKGNSLGIYFTIMEITYDNQKLRLKSPGIDGNIEIYNNTFIDIFNLIKANNRELEEVKSPTKDNDEIEDKKVEYWLKRKNFD